jgi:hypothetical protein
MGAGTAAETCIDGKRRKDQDQACPGMKRFGEKGVDDKEKRDRDEDQGGQGIP